MHTHEIKKKPCNGYSFLSTWITKTKDNFHGGWHGAWGNDMGHCPLVGTLQIWFTCENSVYSSQT